MNKLKTDFQFGVLPKMPMKDKTLSIQAKAIFAYLCAYAGNDGFSFPSRDLMQYELNVAKNTLGKYLKELKLSGYITIEKAKTSTNQFSNNIYHLHAEPCIKPCDTETCDTADCDTTINNDTKNNNTKNNNLQFSEKTACVFKNLSDYCLEKFDKPIRKHNNNYDLDDLYDFMVDDTEYFYDFINRRINTYDKCCLDYLDAIKADFAPELYEQ